MTPFIDIKAARDFALEAYEHYRDRNMTGDFMEWLDGLYVQLGENWAEIPLFELWMLQNLREEGLWLAPAFAQNALLKLSDRLGRVTTGMSDH